MVLSVTIGMNVQAQPVVDAQTPPVGIERMVYVPWIKPPAEVPVFYSVRANMEAMVTLEAINSKCQLAFEVHQGQAKTVTVSLEGVGEVTGVQGARIKDWAVRVAPDGKRYLDVRTTPEGDDNYPMKVDAVVSMESKRKGDQVDVLLPGPANATGFALNLKVSRSDAVDMKVTVLQGLFPTGPSTQFQYVSSESSKLQLNVMPAGVRLKGLEMVESGLKGQLAKEGKSISFAFKGKVRSEGPGSTLALLLGKVALVSGVSGDGWRVALRKTKGGEWVHDLITDRAGEMAVDFVFDVPVAKASDWQHMNFELPAGVVVPVVLEGFQDNVDFSDGSALVPRKHDGGLIGFLPATGKATMAWKSRDKVEDGSLFFSSVETSDVRVSSGLLRQRTWIDLRVLQGKLAELVMDLAGDGEVLSVAGESVIGWSVKSDQGKRRLEVKLSRPIDKADRITVESQVALQGSPLHAGAIRLMPSGSLRHSGWLRVANEGSVRIDVLNTKGLIQLAPHQFPGGVDKELRQVLVYRFPSAEYDYEVHAAQIMPEIGLSEVSVYELGDTDLRILTDLELDVHEAPVREWQFEIPADYAVSSVTGAQVLDYAVGSEVRDGMRSLNVIFRGAVSGRQLVSVVMTKNQSPEPGQWVLPPLKFPEVKSRRGYIGVVAVAGYRMNVIGQTGFAEIPVTFFPKKVAGMQQAFRLREKEWMAKIGVESLGQSVQADVFHLYSLKSGAVYGSVLINYFVVGAPATEWRIEVPEGIGNVDVTGQNVGRDWRRSGNTMIIPLSRGVLGTGTVLLTFEQPMNSRGGKLLPGAVHPLNVQSERGIIQVVSPLQVNHQSTSKGSLLEIDASEIPTEFRLLSTAPTLSAWQYTARDFEIAMEVQWFDPGETIDQVVDFQKLSTQVSRDGQWVTSSSIFVKTRGRSVLRMQLPDGVVLWEAKVNGEAVNARADGKDTLVPLSSVMDPTKAVEISLMYGAKSTSSRKASLTAPIFDVPVVIGEWTVTGDEGKQLVPRGGSANLVRPVMAETGWQWLATHSGKGVWLLILGMLSISFRSMGENRVFKMAALLGGLLFLISTAVIALAAMVTTHGSAGLLEYTAPVVGANQAITIEVGNVSPWFARTGWSVWLGFFIGIVIAVRGWIQGGDRLWMGCGIAMVIASFLSIHGGAGLFFLVLGLAGLFWWLPLVVSTIRGWKQAKVAAAALVIGFVCLCLPEARAEEVEVVKELKPAESMIHDWVIRKNRLYGSVEVGVSGLAGDRYLLLESPAVVSAFEGQGLKVVKGSRGGETVYWLEALQAGRLKGKMQFQMSIPDPAKGWKMPGGPSAVRNVTLRMDQAGWEFISPAAAKVQPLEGLKPNQSGVFMAMSPMDEVLIQARTLQRDASIEQSRYYAEVANMFVPGPGVVNGKHRVSIRPAQGQLGALVMTVPTGFTVSDVVEGPVGNWRFDPKTNELRVTIEPAQIKAFQFTVETQRSAGDLPMDLSLQPLRVKGSAGEVGLIGLAFGDEVQPEGVKAGALPKVNPEDFDATLLPLNSKKEALAVLLHAFRYGADKAEVSLRVNPVAPEIRSHLSQLVSLGEDRLVVTGDLEVNITRAGVFQVTLEVPDSLEVETATGEGLSHWTQQQSGDKRTVVLHLSSKTIGSRTFSLTLIGRPTGEKDEWFVPKIRCLNSSRETGVLTVVPERGQRVRAVKRKNVVLMDPRDMAGLNNQVSRESVKPDAMSYRLLQGDWTLGLQIQRLDPWVTAQVLHDTTIREGQVLSKLDINYRIDNAAVKSQRIIIPGLDKKSAATLRATGAAVADLEVIDAEKGIWEIRFQRGLAGNASVTLEYQRLGAETQEESVLPIKLVDVRQVEYVMTLRAGGRLELETSELPGGWMRSDWKAAQVLLGQSAGGEPPTMTFRVGDAEAPLKVKIKRHELASLRKLRVSSGVLTTLMSPNGNTLTAVNLQMKVLAKTTMRLKLPEGSELFNVHVNDEGAPLVREGGDWLFYVSPSPDSEKESEVRFVYSSGNIKKGALVGPDLDMPMENLTWRVLVPEGWAMVDYEGNFDLIEQENLGEFRLEDYQSLIVSRNEVEKSKVVKKLDQANDWLEAGDQRKASQALSNALNNGQLDAASTEDARVQLRKLKTQQAVLGLNSRRQKLMLDNRNSTQQGDINPQMNQAANMNPVLQGQYNYDPKQYERFLEGNTADENAALRAIANRIVSQQLAAEPAPAALDITLPERGTVLSFGRSLQVGSDEPMSLRIQIKHGGSSFSWVGILICLMAGAMGVRQLGLRLNK